MYLATQAWDAQSHIERRCPTTSRDRYQCVCRLSVSQGAQSDGHVTARELRDGSFPCPHLVLFRKMRSAGVGPPSSNPGSGISSTGTRLPTGRVIHGWQSSLAAATWRYRAARPGDVACRRGPLRSRSDGSRGRAAQAQRHAYADHGGDVRHRHDDGRGAAMAPRRDGAGRSFRHDLARLRRDGARSPGRRVVSRSESCGPNGSKVSISTSMAGR